MQKVYIAGPMRGYEKYNFPAFDRAAQRIRDRYGWETVNPADLDRAVGVNEDTDPLPPNFMTGAMRRDLAAISSDCKGIVLLPGWEASSGVEIELQVAKACGLNVYFYKEQAGVLPWTVAPTTYEEVERIKAAAFGAVEGEQLVQTFSGPMLVKADDNPYVVSQSSQLQKMEDPYEAAAKVRKFGTGATRDSEDGKHDFEGFLSPAVLLAFGEYMHEHRHLRDGSLRASDNWQKGIPRDVYMKSLVRHLFDLWALHRGHDVVRPEDGKAVEFNETLSALLFNVQGYFHEYLKEAA